MNPASGNPATTHEVLALAMIATLKQTADYNISNKLLKVGCLAFYLSVLSKMCSAAVSLLTRRGCTCKYCKYSQLEPYEVSPLWIFSSFLEHVAACFEHPLLYYFAI